MVGVMTQMTRAPNRLRNSEKDAEVDAERAVHRPVSEDGRVQMKMSDGIRQPHGPACDDDRKSDEGGSAARDCPSCADRQKNGVTGRDHH
jgi:hypothetical protein